jgi:TIR domain
MMPSENINVFVSYSHADAALVAPVVKLLRTNKSLVFQDLDDIQPGKKWRNEIAKALAESHLVVVFWCGHASQSNEISKEWKAAIEQKKDILPLLLDATPLPPELGEFQWIDFRGMVGANHGSIYSSANKLDARKSSNSALFWPKLVALAVVIAIVVFPTLFLTKNAPVIPKTLPIPVPAEPTPLQVEYDYVSQPLFMLGAFFTITACLIWLLRRYSKGKGSANLARPSPSDIERHLASELEAEIIRRTAFIRDGIS